MRREQRLAHVARQLYETTEEEKEVKKRRENLRSEFFRLSDIGKGTTGGRNILPVRTVEVPEDFFQATALSQEEFITRRYPGWNVEHVELNTVSKVRTFVLKRDTKYVSSVVEIEDEGQIVRVSKEVVEYSPEVDFDTLKMERPDLFNALAEEVTTYVLNDDAFEQLIAEYPEELAVIERHLVVKEPALRATAKRVKDED
jgi:hypothetical protein